MSFELFIAIHAENMSENMLHTSIYMYSIMLVMRPIWMLRIVRFGPNFHQNEEEKQRNSNNLVLLVLV